MYIGDWFLAGIHPDRKFLSRPCLKILDTMVWMERKSQEMEMAPLRPASLMPYFVR